MVAVAEAVPDAWACTTRRLEADVCTLAGQLSAATCRWLLLIVELDRRKAYEQWGCTSMAQWLSWKCERARIVAGRQHVRVARALTQLPIICDRFSAGVLSYSKVRALTRIATPTTEAKLVEFAEVATRTRSSSAPSAPTNESRSTGTPPPRRSRHAA